MKSHDTPKVAVLRTLLYAQVFDAGLRREDFLRLLITPQDFTSAQVTRALRAQLASRVVHHQDIWVWIGRRQKSKSLQRKWDQSQRKKNLLLSLLPLIVWIPTIHGIAITGSVAVGNAGESEDIDLMIVTKTGFLWTTRALVEGILLLRGVLRTRKMRKVKNKLCLNLWLDERSLLLPTHTLYVAREVVQAQWVVNRNHARERMLLCNPWISSFVFIPKRKLISNALLLPKSITSRVAELLWYPIERFVFWLQTHHMKRTREIVTIHAAFFHPRDTQGSVLLAYKKLCARFRIDSLVR